MIFAGCAEIRVETSLHPNGKIAKSMHYRGEQLHGPWQEWSERGVLTVDSHYAKGKREGTMRRWRDDASLWVECQYEQGRRHGTRTRYATNGTVVVSGVYEHGRPVSGKFTAVFYDAGSGKKFGGIMNYGNGRLINAKLIDGSPVSGAYHIAFNPAPGEAEGAENEQRIFFADGIVLKVTDAKGRHLPSGSWRKDFR